MSEGRFDGHRINCHLVASQNRLIHINIYTLDRTNLKTIYANFDANWTALIKYLTEFNPMFIELLRFHISNVLFEAKVKNWSNFIGL